MAHPNKSEVEDSHNAKMRRMTMHYGEADPKANFKAPSEKYKLEGPEPHVGFGADSSAVNARSDKPARRSAAANPIATYKRGGKVKKHRDSGGDVSAIEEANKDQAAAAPASRARGGRLHHKGKGSTHVNVMIAPQGAGAPPPAIPPQLANAMPKPPMAGPPPAGAPPGGPMMPPPGAGGPPGMPPGAPPMMRKRGGKVHADAAQDKQLIKKELKEEGLIHKAKGGSIHMEGGSLSGPGREDKNKHYKKHGNKSAPVI